MRKPRLKLFPPPADGFRNALAVFSSILFGVSVGVIFSSPIIGGIAGALSVPFFLNQFNKMGKERGG